MGKKRIVKKSGGEGGVKTSGRSGRVVKKRVDTGILHVQATFNNTRLAFSDKKGNILCWSSSGALGFRGAKKGTPFAAAKVGEVVGEQVYAMGANNVSVVVRGVGAGRESSIRAFSAKGPSVVSIIDKTPIPHNGPRPKKPRRV